MTKTCSKCKIERPVNEFYKDLSKKDKLKTECMICCKARNLKQKETIEAVSEKTCYVCGVVKPIDAFNKSGRQKDGHRQTCKQCMRDYRDANKDHILSKAKQYAIDHKDDISEYQHLYKETIPGKFAMWKGAAKHRGIAWNLVLGDISSLPLICFYTGIKLTLKQNQPNTVSLDRINSHLGYTPGNIVFCCASINYMKNDHSIEEFLDLVKKIYQYKIENA